jgi:hypothetical protein
MNKKSLINVYKISPIRSGIPQCHLDEVFFVFFIKTKSPTAGRINEKRYKDKRLIRGGSGIFHVINIQTKASIHQAKKVSDIRNSDNLS